MNNGELIQKMVDDGFCTHYPGYVCDKGFPKACFACIKKWNERCQKKSTREKDKDTEK